MPGKRPNVNFRINRMWKQLTFSFIVGISCAYLAFRNIDLGELWQAMQTVKLGYVALAVIPMIGTHFFRSWRWQIILEPFGKVPFLTLFGINSVGFMMINVLPLRLGEFLRPLLLTRQQNIPYPAALASATVERVFDGVAVLATLVIGIAFSPIRNQQIPNLNVSMSTLVYTAAGAFIPLLLLLLALVFFKDPAIKLLGWLSRILPTTWRQTAMRLIGHFVAGLDSLRGGREIILILFHSVCMWTLSAAAIYLMFCSFSLDLTASAAFTLLGITCLGIMIPGPPGHIGNYHLFAKSALALFAIQPTVAAAFAVILHLFNLLFFVAMGLLFLPFFRFSMADMGKKKQAL